MNDAKEAGTKLKPQTNSSKTFVCVCVIFILFFN